MSRPSLDTVIKIGLVLFSAGGTLALFQSQIARLEQDKLPISRFEADSIRRDLQRVRDEEFQRATTSKLDALVCHQIPTTLGC